MVMLIAFNAFLHIDWVKFILLKGQQNLGIDWDWVLSHYNAFKFDWLLLVVPRVTSDILNFISPLWVGVQDPSH